MFRKTLSRGSGNSKSIKSETKTSTRSCTSGSTSSKSPSSLGNRNKLVQSCQGDIDLLLIGRSGNGKSATGNSILGHEAFRKNTRASSQAVSNPVCSSGVVNGRNITIVDGLNIGENIDGNFNNMDEDIGTITEAFRLSPHGFSAIMIVIKFGVRYSLEETNSLKIVKTIIGQNVIRDYGICVITHGDNFQHALEEEEFSNFKEWCRSQQGDLKLLFEECSFRCVLFNNRTKLPSEMKFQLDQLHSFVERLQNSPLRDISRQYTKPNSRSMLRQKTSDLETETKRVLDNIRSRLKRLEMLNDIDKKASLISMMRELSDFTKTITDTYAESKERQLCILQTEALRMEINGIAKNEGHHESTAELKNTKTAQRLRNISGADDLKNSGRISSQRRNTPEKDNSKMSGPKVATFPTLRGSNGLDGQMESSHVLTDVSTGRRLTDMTTFGESPTKYKTDGEEKLKSLRISFNDVEEDFQKSRTTRNSQLQRLLQETKELREKLQIGSDSVSLCEQLVQKTLELERDLESKLEIFSHEMESSVIERQAKKMKLSGHSKPEQYDNWNQCDGIGNIRSRKTTSITEASSQSIDLLIIGSSGNGTSATGNSIVGKTVFTVSASTTGAYGRSRVGRGSSVIQGQTVNVVDVPGISYNIRDDHCMEQIIQSLEEALDKCNYEFSALLFVLKFGVHFTRQEVETLKLIKTVLGKNVIKDFGICVITHGDNFGHAVEEAAEDGEDLTFEGWCRGQTGEVRSLFEECSFRCVLFDNKTKDMKKKMDQLQMLLKMVDPKKRYSKEKFVGEEIGI